MRFCIGVRRIAQMMVAPSSADVRQRLVETTAGGSVHWRYASIVGQPDEIVAGQPTRAARRVSWRGRTTIKWQYVGGSDTNSHVDCRSESGCHCILLMKCPQLRWQSRNNRKEWCVTFVAEVGTGEKIAQDNVFITIQMNTFWTTFSSEGQNVR